MRGSSSRATRAARVENLCKAVPKDKGPGRFEIQWTLNLNVTQSESLAHRPPQRMSHVLRAHP